MAKNSGIDRSPRYQVSNRVLLAAEVRRAIAAKFGTQAAAARETGVSQPMLSRFVACRVGEIGESMRSRLLRLVQADRRPWVEAALRSPAAKEAAVAYDAWLVRWGERLIREYGRWYSAAGDGAVTESVGAWRSIGRSRELAALLDRVFGVCSVELKKFAVAAYRLGHIDDGEMSRRVVLALWRVLEPLVEYREAGFVERRAGELDDLSFQRFVKAGLLRERILLERSPDEQRAQQVAGQHAAFLADAASHPDPLGDLRDYPDLIDPVNAYMPGGAYTEYEGLQRLGASLIRHAVKSHAPKHGSRAISRKNDPGLLRRFYALSTLPDKQRFYDRAKPRDQEILRPYLASLTERGKRSTR